MKPGRLLALGLVAWAAAAESAAPRRAAPRASPPAHGATVEFRAGMLFPDFLDDRHTPLDPSPALGLAPGYQWPFGLRAGVEAGYSPLRLGQRARSWFSEVLAGPGSIADADVHLFWVGPQISLLLDPAARMRPIVAVGGAYGRFDLFGAEGGDYHRDGFGWNAGLGFETGRRVAVTVVASYMDTRIERLDVSAFWVSVGLRLTFARSR